MQEATVDIVLDPLTKDGYETIRKQVGDEAADEMAICAWIRSRLARQLVRMIALARGDQVVEVWLEKPEGEEDA